MCQQAISVETSADLSVNIETAREIMGKNFIGPDDIAEHAEINFSPDDLAFYSKVPFSKKTLLKCQNTHVLICGISVNTLWIYINVPEGRLHFDSDPWWFEEPFACNHRTLKGWYLIRRNVIPDSIGKTYDEKVKIVDAHDEDVPMACELIYLMMFYYLVTGIRLFESIKTQCRDICINKINFHIGFFQKGHIDVRGRNGPELSQDVGIAGMRRTEIVL